MTLAQLSGLAGISLSYLADIEHDRTAPSLARLQGIAEGLGMNARELLRGVAPFDT